MADDDVSREGQPVDDSWLEFYLFSYGIFDFCFFFAFDNTQWSNIHGQPTKLLNFHLLSNLQKPKKSMRHFLQSIKMKWLKK